MNWVNQPLCPVNFRCFTVSYFAQRFLYLVQLNFTIENVIRYVIFMFIDRYFLLFSFEFCTCVLTRWWFSFLENNRKIDVVQFCFRLSSVNADVSRNPNNLLDCYYTFLQDLILIYSFASNHAFVIVA